jgi:Fe2+ transport protein
MTARTLKPCGALCATALAASCFFSAAQAQTAPAPNTTATVPNDKLAVPVVQALNPAADPAKNAVLIGRVATGGMVVQLEIEGSEPMWMQMGSPPTWGAHQPGADERYHVELKLSDPKTKTRIPYASSIFTAKNTDSGKTMSLPLPPMWGSSGLHYSANSALLGDGAYAATITVDVPTFQRELKDKDLWPKPVIANFHFKLKDGKLTEVSRVAAK